MRSNKIISLISMFGLLLSIMLVTSVGTTTAQATALDERLATPVLATGVVVRDGVPVAGAKIMFAVWPDDATWAANTTSRKPIATKEVAEVTTDAQGRFTARSAVTSAGRGFINNGAATVQATVFTGGESMTLAFVTGVGASWTSPSDTKGRPNDLFFDIGDNATNAWVTTNPPSKWEDSDKAVPVGKWDTPTTVDASGRVSYPCYGTPVYTYVGPSWQPVFEHFGYIYGSPGFRGSIQHSTASQHNLGMGLQIEGTGPWGASGEYAFTETSSRSQETGYLEDVKVWSAIKVGLYNYTTTGTTGYCYVGKVTRANGQYDAIAKVERTLSQIYSYKVPYQICNTSPFTTYGATTYGRQATYSVGLEGPYVKTSASAGWGTSNRQVWQYAAHTCRWLWLNTPNGPANSRLWSYSTFGGEAAPGTEGRTFSDAGLVDQQ